MAESNREEIAKLEALYASNPEGRVFTHLAEAYRKAGELDRARSIVEQGLKKHPAYASAHVVLGRILLDQHKPEEATTAFRCVLDLDPQNQIALRSLEELSAAPVGEPQTTTEPLAEFEAPPMAEPEPAAEPTPVSEFAEWAPETSAEQLPGDLAEFAGVKPDPTTQAYQSVDPLAELSALNTAPEKTDEAPPEPAVNAEPAAAEPETAAEAPAADAATEAPMAEAAAEAPTAEAAAITSEATATETQVADTSPAEAPLITAESPAPEEPTGEVVTETIAELYRSQGLYDRAADVYHALLLQRPGDAGLEQKLREVEDMALGPVVLPKLDEPFKSEPWESPATWQPEPTFDETARAAEEARSEQSAHSEQAEAWLAGAEVAAESAPTPYAWSEQSAAADQDGGPQIRDYFQHLLAWKPSGAAAAPEPPAEAEAQTTGDIEMEPDTMLLLDEATQTEAVATEDFFAVTEPAPEGGRAAGPSAGPQQTPTPPPPIAVTMPFPMPTSSASDRSLPSAESVADAFDEWFGSEPAPAAAAPAAAAPTSSPAPPTAPTATPPATAEEASVSEDDDDLEMFRSWLQSLKK